MNYSSCGQKIVLLKVYGVIRPDTFLFLCQSYLILLLGNACVSELLWISESMQTLCYLLFISFIYIGFFLKASLIYSDFFFLVELDCKVFLSNYIKHLYGCQSPLLIPFLYDELQTPEMIWSFHLVGEDWHVSWGSRVLSFDFLLFCNLRQCSLSWDALP